MGNFKPNYRPDRGGSRFGRRDDEKPMMHDAICAECGNNCQVPFRPSGDRPIYCSKCFESKRNGNDNSRRSDRRNFDRLRYEEKHIPTLTSCDCGKIIAKSNNQLIEQLTSINAKLEVIIGDLNPKVVKKVSPKKESVKKRL